MIGCNQYKKPSTANINTYVEVDRVTLLMFFSFLHRDQCNFDLNKNI